MENPAPPRWLEWAREIQAIAQSGSHYAENDYQRQRFQRLSQIAAEIVHEYSTLSYPMLADAFGAQVGYATPRVDVRAAVFQEGRLLLVRERQDGGWTMPGGWMDVGEMPSLAAERETLEEAGYHVKAQRIVGVYDANRVGPLEVFHAVKLVYMCDLIGGEARSSQETSEVCFYSPDEIPTFLSGERTKPRHIADAIAALHDPSKSTVFD